MHKTFKNLKITTDRLIIRPYCAKDTDAAWRVLSHPKIYPTTYAIQKDYPRNRVVWWFQCINNNMNYGTSYEFGMFDKISGEYIGNCGIINILAAHKSGMITYFTDPEKWNCGYATEAAAAMLHFGFDILSLNRIGGTCMSINPASASVMKKIGMKFEGTAHQELLKDGIYYDIQHFAVLRSDYYEKPDNKR